jgi:DNA-binding LacI/PurR family transcriptional regulator
MISSLELARQCGVSQGTVDRALHNRPGVSQKTRDKVLRAAKKHGYRPHPAAREILTGKSLTVGAILPAVNIVFFMDLFNELGRALAKQGLRLQLTSVENKQAFLDVLEDFAARRYRLAVVIPPQERIEVPKAITAGVPVVSLFSPCLGTHTHFIAGDERQTGRDAVRYLHKRGHQRILHLTYARMAHAIMLRAEGYRLQCQDLGLPSKGLANPDAKSLRKALQEFQPTAIFCHNDWLALRTCVMLSEMGLRVPEDLSVLGVDNSPTLAALHPGLTTLAYPMASAVNAIMQVLAKKPSRLPLDRYLLVERTTVRNLAQPAMKGKKP